MSIIRFLTEEVFGTDSQEYEVLVNAAKKVAVPGIVAEIGTRRGGSAKMMMDALVETGQNNRPFICIDPYGNIEIECTNLNMSVHYPGSKIGDGPADSKEITSPHRFDYNNDMRNRTIPSLYFYAYQAGFNFTFFCLEDTEFAVRYSDGVPVYENEKRIENKYAMVFFDGPHDNPSLEFETSFFMERSVIGTVFVMDDIWMYDHDKIEEMLFADGWEVLEKKSIKASYIKVK